MSQLPEIMPLERKLIKNPPNRPLTQQGGGGEITFPYHSIQKKHKAFRFTYTVSVKGLGGECHHTV